MRINVELQGEDRYSVTVEDEVTSSTHQVSLSEEEKARFGEGVSSQQLLEAAFLFLLDREQKESILGEFSFSIIEVYFPDFSERLPAYLDKTAKMA